MASRPENGESLGTLAAVVQNVTVYIILCSNNTVLVLLKSVQTDVKLKGRLLFPLLGLAWCARRMSSMETRL